MAKLQWDETGKRIYETGTSNGVLYPTQNDGRYASGVAWNGLSGVSQSPEGGEPTNVYANNKKYLSLQSAEEFKGSIKAYTYPDEFAECDGSKEVADGVYAGMQTRRSFGLAYITKIGNDVQGVDFGEKIHLVYGAKASPSSREYATINDSPEAIEFSWDFTTTPAEVTTEGVKPTAYLCIDTTKVTRKENIKELKDKLFGTESSEPTLPSIDEVINIMKKNG